jgi:glycosyltransferase involved in cell wall biosynthesis
MRAPDLNADLVFVSLENWDEIWRRNQFLCAELAARFPGRKILFVEPARRGADATLHPLAEYSNIVRLRPRKLAPNALPLGRQINENAFRRAVVGAMRSLEITEPWLWINAHDAAHLAGALNERAVIYDITDDWTLTDLPPQEKQRIVAQDEYLCRRADLTIVCSQALYDSRKAVTKKILLLQNGVHLERYRNLEQYSDSAPQWPHPVFGYTGTLHAERVDADLVLALAREYSAGSVVLIGPDALDAATRARLAAQPNVHLTGAIAYNAVPRHMAGFDVCIVPHRESPFTESLNPLKLWEYLACGKPVAATNVAGFREYAALCHIGSGEAGFLNACRNALAENDESRISARQAAVAAHSWDARVDELLCALAEQETR